MDDNLLKYIANAQRNLAHIERKLRHLGPADECCPRCGGPVETLLDSNGRNPMRCCWRCEAAASDLPHDEV